MNIKIDPSRIFTRQQVDVMLTAAINKTLLQVDKVKLFAHHEGRDKVKSIAGSIKKYSTMERKEIEVFSEKVDIFYLLGVLNSKRANELLDDIRLLNNALILMPGQLGNQTMQLWGQSLVTRRTFAFFLFSLLLVSINPAE